MGPVSDPPPSPDLPTVASPATFTAVAAANPTPSQASAHNHPPYAEMITAAISTLKERNGSSRRAISNYIDSNYSDLPSTHQALLTHHLKRLKTNGQLVMVKHSYKLPRSAAAPTAPVNGAVNAVSPDPISSVTKRRPGRPPKPKPDSVQVAVPVFEPLINMNAPPVVPVAEPQPNVAIRTVNGTTAAAAAASVGPAPKRGPGRPPKTVGVGRGRGRPKIVAAPVVQVRKTTGRPRGRPSKHINVVEGSSSGEVAPAGGVPAPSGAVGVGIPSVVEPVTGKRSRGRPPNKSRKLNYKPLGRPKKNNASATTVNRTPDSQLLVAYLDLKAKLENLQSRIRQTANMIKPSLSNEAAINALRELELIAMNVTTWAPAQNLQQQSLQSE